MALRKQEFEHWEIWAVILLIVGMYIFTPQIFNPVIIYGEFPRIDGVYTDAFHEANPLTPKVCADNEVKFLKELPVVISVSKGESRTSGCLCGHGTEEKNSRDWSSRECCSYYGYEKQAWLGICYGCVDYDIPEKVEIELNGEIVGTLTDLDGSVAFDLAEHLNRINYDNIIYNIETGDIEPYENCVRIIATSSDNYGFLHITDSPKPVYYEDPCDYKQYNDEYCKVWVEPEPEEEIINETTDVDVPEKEEPDFITPPGEDEVEEEEQEEEPEDKNFTMYMALIIVAVIGYIIYKRQYKK